MDDRTLKKADTKNLRSGRRTGMGGIRDASFIPDQGSLVGRGECHGDAMDPGGLMCAERLPVA